MLYWSIWSAHSLNPEMAIFEPQKGAPSFVVLLTLQSQTAFFWPFHVCIQVFLFSSTPCSKEKTGVDRFSLRQAVIFICATNRPDELDLEFVRPGRIDRRLYIGLPDAKQRVQIFGVHSAGKQLAEDVNFEQVS